MSLKKEILDRAKRHEGWIHGGEIERLAMKLGYKPSTGGRDARQLEEDGKLKKKLNDKGHVMYCHPDYYQNLRQETLL